MSAALTNAYKVNPSQAATLKTLFSEICLILNVDEEDVRSSCRQQDMVICRGVYCHIATQFTKYPLRAIASVIGGRDHSTIINSKKRAKIMLDAKDALFRKSLMLCMSKSQAVKELMLKNGIPDCEFFTIQDMKDAFDAGKNGVNKDFWFKKKFAIDINDRKLYAHTH